MNQSESIKNLALALSKAQGTIKGALKDSENPFFKSKYADLASVVEAIRDAFSGNELSYVQLMGEATDNEVKVGTMIMHSSGEWLFCGFLTLPVTKADAQGFGSALTYARRYSLSAATGVAPEDDDGNAAAKAAPKKATPQTGWGIEPLERFEAIADRAYDAFKAGGAPGEYDKFRKSWRECRASGKDSAEAVLTAMAAAVQKLEDAAEEKAKKAVTP